LALVAHAAGIYCEEAAVRLLIGHRSWLCREDFLAAYIQLGVVEACAFACVDWTGVAAALQTGRLACSHGERQVLLLAASLAEGVPVDLRDALASLDDTTAALVTNAIMHAAGHQLGVTTAGDGMSW
jgi:hypothetical protein